MPRVFLNELKKMEALSDRLVFVAKGCGYGLETASFNLKGKVIIVTGGNTGIGEITARRLVKYVTDCVLETLL